MIASAYIELYQPGQRENDAAVVAEGVTALRLPWTGFFPKQASRRQIPFRADTLVAGTIPSIRHALRSLGREFPSPDDYPAVLRGCLRRKVWTSQWNQCEHLIGEVFVKPRFSVKSFTGFVVGQPTLARVRPRDQVWCSEVVRFVSEYRAFCALGRVLTIQHYHGDRTPIDADLVAWAAGEYYRAGGGAAFILDFGTLDTGETALIEANDAFSCGAYGADPRLYTITLGTRWIELTQGRDAAVAWASGALP